MSKKFNKRFLDNLTRNFMESLESTKENSLTEELATSIYPSVGQHKPFTNPGINNEPSEQIPSQYDIAHIDVNAEIEKLFYHFSPQEILSAVADEIQSLSQKEEGNIDHRESLLSVAGQLKSIINQFRL